METILTLLAEIERLTLEQRDLIKLENKDALEQNLERKEQLIESVRSIPDISINDAIRSSLERIAQLELENIQMAKDEMERLKDMMKKTQEAKTTVRGYDTFSAGVGATYIDKKH